MRRPSTVLLPIALLSLTALLAGSALAAAPNDYGRLDPVRRGQPLRLGHRGDAVRALQRALDAAGETLRADGVFGRDTHAAVRRFQSRERLAVDGIFGRGSLEALDRVLGVGASGPPVPPSPGGITAAELVRPETFGQAFTGSGPISRVQSGGETRAFQYTAKMAIDADGAPNVTRDRDAAARDPNLIYDPWYQPETAMNFRGQPVNSNTVPFMVLPVALMQAMGAQKGDLCEVVYRGRRQYAIFADVGPAGKLGEGSMALARALGISDDPHRGGTTRQEITYTVLPGSGLPRGIRSGGPAVTAAAIGRLGADAFAEARRLGWIR